MKDTILTFCGPIYYYGEMKLCMNKRTQGFMIIIITTLDGSQDISENMAE